MAAPRGTSFTSEVLLVILLLLQTLLPEGRGSIGEPWDCVPRVRYLPYIVE